MIKLVFAMALFLGVLHGEEKKETIEEVQVEASARMTLRGNQFNYKIVSGTLVLGRGEGKSEGAVGYTAYFKEGSESSQSRPLTFCFNGGPGAASVWLNTGFLGPKCIDIEDITFLNPPYELVDNEATILDKSDLVFIDPISSGFSKLASPAHAGEFHGVDEDVTAISDFVRQFTTRFKRFDSPKYFVGESYGGLRAVKVAYQLHDEYGYYLNGLLLVSPGLDMQTLISGGCNDLPFVLFLPTMTAIAHYHKKVSGDLKTLLKEAEHFAGAAYVHALFLGDSLPEEKRKQIAGQLAHFTGLSEELILRLNLRVPAHRFLKELLYSDGKVVGRFDGRITGEDSKEYEIYSTYDPSLNDVFGAVTATFSQYLLKELNWPEQRDYGVLVSIPNWNWGKGNQYASCIKDLRQLLAQNSKLKVVVMEGLYDCATPYRSIEHAVLHLGFGRENKERIKQFIYPAGHMMYFNRDIKKSMRKDIDSFFNLD